MTTDIQPLPLQPRTRTGTTETDLATPAVTPPIVPANGVARQTTNPQPAQARSPRKVTAWKPKSPKSELPAEPTLVTPDEALRGKVSRCNSAGRFVVLEFPVTHLPSVGQSLFVYREGLKVGELRVTGPQRDDRTVADVTAGEAQVGDEVRDW